MLRQYLRDWQGPPVRVVVGARTYDLGGGPPRAVVRLPQQVLRCWWRPPTLAFGEAYTAGRISVTGSLLDVLAGFHLSEAARRRWSRPLSLASCFARWIPDTVARAVKNARRHYDIGDNFYELWLDPSRTYSCAYYPRGDETLAQAQEKKRDLICRKLQLRPGHTLLDIGCGWGSLLFHAAQHYGAVVTGVTPARNQVEFIRREAKLRGLEKRVRVVGEDWRRTSGRFDRVVSVGMFEHVGKAQHAPFLRKWRQLLADDGVSLLHTIGRRRPAPPDPWVRKYIFPGGYLPTLEDITCSAAAAGLELFRVENLRQHYARTLEHWAENYRRVRQRVVEMFDERFARMWWLYLLGSQASFRWGELQLLQLELYGPRACLPDSRQLPSATTRPSDASPSLPSGERNRQAAS